MPFVNIKINREGATREQKEKLIQGATQILVDVLGKNPAATVIVIEEVETDNWGIPARETSCSISAKPSRLDQSLYFPHWNGWPLCVHTSRYPEEHKTGASRW